MQSASKKSLMYNLKFRGVWLASAVLSFVLLISQPCKAKAQRTMSGQSILTAEAGLLSFVHPGDFSLNIDYGQYLLSGYWYGSLNAEHNRIATTTAYDIRYIDAYASGGYLHRLLTCRSRIFGLYVGGGAFLGYEFIDPMNERPSNITTTLPGGCFLYGIIPEIEIEIFFLRKAALTIGADSPIFFSSPLRKIHPRLKLGLRMNI